jgi:hypothetical protein
MFTRWYPAALLQPARSGHLGTQALQLLVERRLVGQQYGDARVSAGNLLLILSVCFRVLPWLNCS